MTIQKQSTIKTLIYNELELSILCKNAKIFQTKHRKNSKPGQFYNESQRNRVC